MFMIDIETLGSESTSVILSLCCIYFDPNKTNTLKELESNSIFVKFDTVEQLNLGRTYEKSVMDWWTSRPLETQQMSFIPSNDDVKVRDGLTLFTEYLKEYNKDNKAIYWQRGGLDQLCLGSLCKVVLDDKDLLPFWRWRDVRTAIDIMYNSNNGYCEVNPEVLNRGEIKKHNPIHDCALDIMMLQSGISY